jgi:hypothetical protein
MTRNDDDQTYFLTLPEWHGQLTVRQEISVYAKEDPIQLTAYKERDAGQS